MSNPLIPVARLGASDCPLGTALRVCDEFVTPIPQQAAELLGLRGAVVVQRWITLVVGGETVLAATSYLPVEVAGGAADDCLAWQDGDIGALALVGHPAESVSMQHLTGPPSPGEAKLFHLTEDDTVAVVSRRYLVEADGQSLAAGVVLLAPSEQLVLKSGPEQWDGGALPTVLLVVEPEDVEALERSSGEQGKCQPV